MLHNRPGANRFETCLSVTACTSVLTPRVIVIDDDASVRTALRRLLEAHETPVDTYATPRQFLSAATEDHLGCLVLDVKMPEAHGLEALALLRHAGCRIPVVFISGTEDTQLTTRAMSAGAVDVLTKPFTDSAFLSAVSRAIASASTDDSHAFALMSNHDRAY